MRKPIILLLLAAAVFIALATLLYSRSSSELKVVVDAEDRAVADKPKYIGDVPLPYGNPIDDATIPDNGWILPATLNAELVTQWLIDEGFFSLEGGEVQFETEPFRALELYQAVTIYQAFFAEPQGGKYEPVRLLFYALCAYMEPKVRSNFVIRTEAFSAKLRKKGVGAKNSDLTNLMHLFASEDNAIYINAIRRFAPVIGEEAVVRALRSHNAFFVDATGNWTIQVNRALSDFDADTLQALVDGMDASTFGDRGDLRRAVAELVKQKRN